MSRTIIKGEDCALFLENKQALHATSHTLSVQLEVTDFRTKDTNGNELAPGDVTWTAQLEGLVVIESDNTTSMKSEEVLDALLNKTLLDAVFKSRTAGAALGKTYTGKGYITSYDYSAPVGDKMSYSATLTGSGTLVAATDTAVNQQSNQND